MRIRHEAAAHDREIRRRADHAARATQARQRRKRDTGVGERHRSGERRPVRQDEDHAGRADHGARWDGASHLGVRVHPNVRRLRIRLAGLAEQDLQDILEARAGDR